MRVRVRRSAVSAVVSRRRYVRALQSGSGWTCGTIIVDYGGRSLGLSFCSRRFDFGIMSAVPFSPYADLATNLAISKNHEQPADHG